MQLAIQTVELNLTTKSVSLSESSFAFLRLTRSVFSDHRATIYTLAALWRMSDDYSG